MMNQMSAHTANAAHHVTGSIFHQPTGLEHTIQAKTALHCFSLTL